MSKYRMLVMDMDDTLVDSKHIMHRETIDALTALREKGIITVYCTGRRTYEMHRHEYQYGCVDYVILNTGSMIMDMRDRSIIFDRRCDIEDTRKLLDACLKNDWQNYVILNDGYALNIMTPGVQDYINNVGVAPLMFDSTDKLDMSKVIGFMAARDRAFIADYIDRNRLKFTWIQSEPDCYDITPEGATKWSAVKALADMLNISCCEIVSMGNEHNDIEMVVNSGVGVSVANGVPKLREAADYVTARDNNHDAVVEVKEKFFD